MQLSQDVSRDVGILREKFTLLRKKIKTGFFLSGQFCCVFIRGTTDIVCRREPQYILFAHFTLVNTIYFVVGEYFSYT
jgi:hypothetical protein